MIYIDDFLDDMFSVLPIVKNDLINIGAEQIISDTSVQNIICEEARNDPSAIGYDENAYVGARSKILNCEKLKRLFLLERTELRLGLAELLNGWENELFLALKKRSCLISCEKNYRKLLFEYNEISVYEK